MASARYDLHVHSTASDGKLSPREVVALAVDRGLAGIALTDHDTVAGLDEAEAMAQALGVLLVPGVEVSCTSADSRQVHMLAYFVDRTDADLLALLDSMERERRARAAAMVERIHQLAGVLTLDDVLEQSGGRAPGRPHIARAMAEAGIVAEPQDAFSEEWIGPGGRAWVARFGVPMAQAIDVVHGAGGAAVFAHPGRSKHHDGEAAIRAAAAAGLDGIEVDHPGHNEAAIRRCADLARELDLVQTGGSDDHGTGVDGPSLGCRTVSERVVQQLERAAGQYRLA
jgi:predicted metal-dependent phosphoesterase TrpH